MTKVRKKIIYSILVITVLSVSIFLGMNRKYIYINKKMSTKEYSYLPTEAKNIIKDVYKETGTLVKTEKNKEENVPYLNPKYVEYLTMSNEEKSNLDIIPNLYTVDYDYTKVESSGDLESSYDLRNVNGKKFITPLKNQGSLGVCWAVSATEQAESLLLQKNNTSYNSNSKIFSPRQIDYATSTDGIDSFTNEYGYRTIGTGGNFYMSSEILSYGLSLVDESKMPYNVLKNKKELSEVLSYKDSNYELNNAVGLPNIYQRENLDYEENLQYCANNYPDTNDLNACIAEYQTELKNKYIEVIKEGVKNYGGVVVETVSPQGSCGFKNSDGNYVIDQHVCYKDAEGHAMQIIGWDDEYSYSYCKLSSSNANVNSNGTCSSGTKVTGKGAFLIRNSWGEGEYSYPYMTYNSVDNDKNSPGYYYMTDMNPTSERTWDNLYAKSFNKESTYRFARTITSSFTKKISGTEKIEKIKFNAMTADATYSVEIATGGSNHRYNNVLQTTYPGIYTIDLSDKNVYLNNDDFTITLSTSDSKSYTMKNSISVFTSNVDEEPIVKMKDFKGWVIDSPRVVTSRVFTYTKNIPSGEEINFTLKKSDGQDYSNYLTVTNNVVADNNVNPIVTVAKGLPVGDYTLSEYYGTAKEDVTVRVKGQPITVTYYANNGTNNSIVENQYTQTPFTLKANNFSKTGYKFIGWTTSSNGSGTFYSNKQTIESLDDNLVLYAQWEPINYRLTFDANGGEGTLEDQIIPYDTYRFIQANMFTRTGYTFVEWNTESDGTGTRYVDNQMIRNIVDDEYTITLYAQWKPITYKVLFNSNGGQGTMSSQTFTYDNQTGSLERNKFTRKGYTFTWWNTKADGTGTIYHDGKTIINITTKNNDEIELFAQWTPNTYKVTFDSNGGEGSMDNLSITYDSPKNLPINTYTKENYQFKEWNTKADGTGETYIDGQEVSLEDNITLYAIWTKLEGKITYNSNNDNNEYKVQSINYDEDTTLDNNSFEYTNYVFINWNTKADGTGTTYNNNQVVNLQENLELYAQWEIKKYTITFNMNGSNLTRPTNLKVSILDNVVLPIVKSNDYYDFYGWYLDSKCTKYFSDKKLTSNITLYAKTSKKIGKMTIKGIANKYYTGKNITQAISIYDGKKLLRQNIDYILIYSNNKNIGLASVRITGINNYSSATTRSFKIIPKGTKLLKVTSPKKHKAVLQFNKVAGGVYYQVAYRKGSKYKYFYTKTTKPYREFFTSKKTYQFLVRPYKEVKGVKYFGPWSNSKKIKIK